MDRILSCELVSMATYRVYKPWLFEGLMLQVFNMRIILACIYYSNYILIKHTVTYAIVYVNENHGSYEYILESMICLFYLYKYMNSFCSIIFQ